MRAEISDITSQNTADIDLHSKLLVVTIQPLIVHLIAKLILAIRSSLNYAQMRYCKLW